jgi:hypothetical protein
MTALPGKHLDMFLSAELERQLDLGPTVWEHAMRASTLVRTAAGLVAPLE